MEKEMGGKEIKVYLGADRIITSAGFSTRENLDAIAAYRSGCAAVDDRSLFGRPFVAGRIDDARLGTLAAGLEDFTRLEKLFILAIGDVVRSAGIDPASKDTAVIFSTTKGNVDLLGTEEPVDEKAFIYTMAVKVASHFGFAESPLVISNACISGVSALIVAARLIREGKYKNIVVAGGDILTGFVVTGFHAFKSVSGGACRPYDAARDGLTLGEGCGAALVTADRQKAAEPCIEIAGGSVSNDSNHISGPSRTGDGLYFAIRDAMGEAGLTPAEVGFLNGHGTATVYNDEMESKAYALAGLCGVPLNGLKPYFGHMLGAAGLVESIVCAHELRSGVVYGTPGFESAGTPHELDVSPRHRDIQAVNCVKTASGFGGCNAAIALKKEDAFQEGMRVPQDRPTGEGNGTPVTGATRKAGIKETARCVIEPTGAPFAEAIRERFKALDAPNMKFYKMDDFCKLGYVAAETLLKDVHLAERYAPEEIGIVLANRSASLDTDLRHRRQMAENGDDVSPAVFVYTLPNVLAGEIAIRHGIQGENTFFIQDSPDAGFVEEYSRMLLEGGRLRAVVCGWCDLLGGDYRAELKLLENIA